MPTAKEKALEWIRALPDDCTLEDIEYQLHLRKKVEAGFRDLEEGRVLTNEEAYHRNCNSCHDQAAEARKGLKIPTSQECLKCHTGQ